MREEEACRRPASDGFSFLVGSVCADGMKALSAGRLLVIARGASEDVSFFSFFVEKRVKLSLASSVWVPLGGGFHSLGPLACVARSLGSMIDSFSSCEGRLGVKRLKKLTESCYFSALF